jgi:molybdenum cofactor biosynthesis enzyme MoaA
MFLFITEVDHVVQVIVDDEVQVHDQDHHHLKVNFLLIKSIEKNEIFIFEKIIIETNVQKHQDEMMNVVVVRTQNQIQMMVHHIKRMGTRFFNYFHLFY